MDGSKLDSAPAPASTIHASDSAAARRNGVRCARRSAERRAATPPPRAPPPPGPRETPEQARRSQSRSQSRSRSRGLVPKRGGDDRRRPRPRALRRALVGRAPAPLGPTRAGAARAFRRDALDPSTAWWDAQRGQPGTRARARRSRSILGFVAVRTARRAHTHTPVDSRWRRAHNRVGFPTVSAHTPPAHTRMRRRRNRVRARAAGRARGGVLIGDDVSADGVGAPVTSWHARFARRRLLVFRSCIATLSSDAREKRTIAAAVPGFASGHFCVVAAHARAHGGAAVSSGGGGGGASSRPRRRSTRNVVRGGIVRRLDPASCCATRRGAGSSRRSRRTFADARADDVRVRADDRARTAPRREPDAPPRWRPGRRHVLAHRARDVSSRSNGAASSSSSFMNAPTHGPTRVPAHVSRASPRPTHLPSARALR